MIETGWAAFEACRLGPDVARRAAPAATGREGPCEHGSCGCPDGFGRIPLHCFAIVRPSASVGSVASPPRVEGYTIGADFPGAGLVMLLILWVKWVVTVGAVESLIR